MQLLQMQSMQRGNSPAIDPCANGHAWGNWQQDIMPYFQVEGKESRTCESINCDEHESQPVPAWTAEEAIHYFASHTCLHEHAEKHSQQVLTNINNHAIMNIGLHHFGEGVVASAQRVQRENHADSNLYNTLKVGRIGGCIANYAGKVLNKRFDISGEIWHDSANFHRPREINITKIKTIDGACFAPLVNFGNMSRPIPSDNIGIDTRSRFEVDNCPFK
jgi:hypothetical protein